MFMSYQGFTKRSALNVILVLLVSLLVACGGGGGGSKPTPTPIPTLAPTPVPDTTPEPFSFTLPAVSPEAGATVTLDALTITGLDAAAIITISGGEYAIDGGAFTALQGIIENSQSLQVQAVASSNFSGEVDVTVTIGGVTESFTLTTIAEDTTPEAFSFSAVTDAALGATVSSNTVTITGLNSPAPVSITGGDYAIGSGTATNLGGTITNGQTLTLSVTTAATFSTATTATVTVGGVTADFVVTTLAQDTTPDVFSFTAQTDVELNTVTTSSAATISGINAAAISIAGGEYAIEGGTYTAEAGTILNGQAVTVQLTSAAATYTAAEATLLIGGVSSVFSVTTVADTTAPTADITFPPPVSMTENVSVMVRGTAEDDYSDITSFTILVNGADSGATIIHDENYATWSAQVDLAEGDNAIVITAGDSQSNSDNNAASVYVKRAALSNVFPNADVNYGSMQNMVFDARDGQESIISVDSSNEDGRLVITELATGLRSEIFVSGLPASALKPMTLVLDAETGVMYLHTEARSDIPGVALSSVNMETWSVTNTLSPQKEDVVVSYGLEIDRSGADPRLLFVNPVEDIVYQSDMGLSVYSVFSSNTHPSAQNPFDIVFEVFYLESTKRIFSGSVENTDTYELNPETGARTLFSTDAKSVDNLDSWENLDENVHEYAEDPRDPQNRLLVAVQKLGVLVSIDLESGERSIFSPDDGVMPFYEETSLVTDRTLGYALVADIDYETMYVSIFAVDLESGQRVVISKSNFN